MTKIKESKKDKFKKKEKVKTSPKKLKPSKEKAKAVKSKKVKESRPKFEKAGTYSRDYVFNDAISKVERLIADTKDTQQSSRLLSIRLDLLDAWNVERTASK